jgi:hypothetical protein
MISCSNSASEPTRWGETIDTINATELDEDRADEQTGPLYEELGTIQRAIVDLRAQSFAGSVAKAWHVHWCRAGDLTTEMDGPGTDFELCLSIVRDLLAIEAVAGLKPPKLTEPSERVRI